MSNNNTPLVGIVEIQQNGQWIELQRVDHVKARAHFNKVAANFTHITQGIQNLDQLIAGMALYEGSNYLMGMSGTHPDPPKMRIRLVKGQRQTVLQLN